MITIRQWQSYSAESVASRFLWHDTPDVIETFYTCHDQFPRGGNSNVKKYGNGFMDDHHNNITSAYLLIIEE